MKEYLRVLGHFHSRQLNDLSFRTKLGCFLCLPSRLEVFSESQLTFLGPDFGSEKQHCCLCCFRNESDTVTTRDGRCAIDLPPYFIGFPHVVSFDTRVPGFPCTHPGCEKVFQSRQSLNRHRHVHNNTRFPCGHAGCDKDYSDAGAATRHRRTHIVPTLPSSAGAAVAGAKRRRDGGDSLGDGGLEVEQDQEDVFDMGVMTA